MVEDLDDNSVSNQLLTQNPKVASLDEAVKFCYTFFHAFAFSLTSFVELRSLSKIMFRRTTKWLSKAESASYFATLSADRFSERRRSSTLLPMK